MVIGAPGGDGALGAGQCYGGRSDPDRAPAGSEPAARAAERQRRASGRAPKRARRARRRPMRPPASVPRHAQRTGACSSTVGAGRSPPPGRRPAGRRCCEDAGRTVIGVDLLGHGDAPKPHDPGRLRRPHRPGSSTPCRPTAPVDAVGFSLGAATLLELACRAAGALRPARRRRGRRQPLPRGRGGAPTASSTPSGARATDSDVRAQLFAQYAEPARQRPGGAGRACCERRGPRPTPSRLAAVTCPVLVVLGDHDFAGPGRSARSTALPDARSSSLKNVDHFATPESFAFIDAALEFLEAVPG